MANRIAGITVEIDGSTTKLQAALKEVNTEIKSTQTRLKDMENGKGENICLRVNCCRCII